MKQKYGWVALAATGALILSGCTPGDSTPAEETPGEVAGTNSLVIYASHPTEMIDFFTARFNELHPEIQIELISGGTGDLLGRIQAEASNPQGDLLWGGGSYTGSSAPELFSKFDSPILKEIDPELIDPEGYNAPFDAFTMVLVYNKELVPESEVPHNWADLADPKWKDKIVSANPASSSTAYGALVNWKIIGGWDLVEGIAKNLIIADSSSAPFTATGNGESPLGVAYEEGAYRWLDSGKIGIIHPDDGIILRAEGLFQIKDGPNAVNAKMFSEFLLATEQQQALVDNFVGWRPANVNVAFPKDLPAAKDVNVLPFPKEAQTEQDAWLDEWKEIVVNIH